jgi:lysylphosphatidylglycerol synthetase-like protein (DUF2156 family)
MSDIKFLSSFVLLFVVLGAVYLIASVVLQDQNNGAVTNWAVLFAQNASTTFFSGAFICFGIIALLVFFLLAEGKEQASFSINQ